MALFRDMTCGLPPGHNPGATASLRDLAESHALWGWHPPQDVRERHPTWSESAAAAFAEAAAYLPHLFDLGPVEGRKAVDEVQSGDIAKPAVDEEWVTVAGGPTGSVRTRIVRPADTTGSTLPVAIYLHGAGCAFGNAHTRGGR